MVSSKVVEMEIFSVAKSAEVLVVLLAFPTVFELVVGKAVLKDFAGVAPMGYLLAVWLVDLLAAWMELRAVDGSEIEAADLMASILVYGQAGS